MKLVLAGRRGFGWGKQGVTINEPEGFFFFLMEMSSDWIMVTSTQLCKSFKNH